MGPCSQFAHARGRKEMGPSQPQLLHRVLSRDNLRDNDASGSEHGSAAVVELPVSHLGVIHAEPEWVAEVARLEVLVLCPDAQLNEEKADDENREDESTWHGDNGVELALPGGTRAIEAWDLDVMLDHRARAGHHGDAAVLDLRGTEFPELLLVHILAEARRVEEPERLRHTNLLGDVELWLLNAVEGEVLLRVWPLCGRGGGLLRCRLGCLLGLLARRGASHAADDAPARCRWPRSPHRRAASQAASAGAGDAPRRRRQGRGLGRANELQSAVGELGVEAHAQGGDLPSCQHLRGWRQSLGDGRVKRRTARLPRVLQATKAGLCGKLWVQLGHNAAALLIGEAPCHGGAAAAARHARAAHCQSRSSSTDGRNDCYLCSSSTRRYLRRWQAGARYLQRCRRSDMTTRHHEPSRGSHRHG
mmetsp:Transcript_9031/g.23409  ORF Transcript_9031/g.23409 Transcript_9031/m.23409 type:complete len:419 (+) Transcript_9031:81-1337(+)